MPNGTYGGVRGKETKVGQKTFVSRPTRLGTPRTEAVDCCSVNMRRGRQKYIPSGKDRTGYTLIIYYN